MARASTFYLGCHCCFKQGLQAGIFGQSPSPRPSFCRCTVQAKQAELTASATKKGVQLKASSKQLDKLRKDIVKLGVLGPCMLLTWQHSHPTPLPTIHQELTTSVMAPAAHLAV